MKAQASKNNKPSKPKEELLMVVHIQRDFVDHDRIVTPKKIATIFTQWILCHTWERMPRLTNKRRQILDQYIQMKGYNAIMTTLAFIASSDPHAIWLRENKYTYFSNIFNDHKWDIRYKRALKYLNKEKK